MGLRDGLEGGLITIGPSFLIRHNCLARGAQLPSSTLNLYLG